MPDITSNRTIRQSPERHHSRIWCGNCDMNHIHVDEKCSVCGFGNNKGRKRNKARDRYIEEPIEETE